MAILSTTLNPLTTERMSNDTLSNERDRQVRQAITQLERVNLSAPAQRLRSLNDTLNDEPQVSKLANVNVYGAFDSAEIEKRAAEESLRRYSTLWSGFEWIRNVLILFPITLTWFSFWLAAHDYGQLLKASPELSGNSFLYLWETGFAGNAALPFLTFSQTALIAAALLLVIIFLTILVHFRKDIATTRATNDAVSVRSALEDALWEVEKELSNLRRQHTEAGVVEDIYRAVTRFGGISDRMVQAVTQMDSGAREWMNLTRDLDLRLGMVVNEMKDEADGLRVFSNGLTGNVDQMFWHVQSATQTSAQLSSSIENLASAIQANTVLQEDKLNDIAAQLTSMEEQARGWGQALRKTTDDLRLAVDKSSTSLASTSGAVATVTGLLKGQEELRATILETHKAMEEHRKWVAETVKGAQMAFEHSINSSVGATQRGEAVTVLADQLRTSLDRLAQSNTEMAREQANALAQIKNEISHTMRAFLNERMTVMQTLEQTTKGRDRSLGGLVPLTAEVRTAPLAFALAASVLISSLLVGFSLFVFLRVLTP